MGNDEAVRIDLTDQTASPLPTKTTTTFSACNCNNIFTNFNLYFLNYAKDPRLQKLSIHAIFLQLLVARICVLICISKCGQKHSVVLSRFFRYYAVVVFFAVVVVFSVVVAVVVVVVAVVVAVVVVDITVGTNWSY